MAYRRQKAKKRRLKAVPKKEKKVVPRKVQLAAHERSLKRAGEEYRKTRIGAEATFLGNRAVYSAEEHLKRVKNVEENVSPGAEQRFRELLSAV